MPNQTTTRLVKPRARGQITIPDKAGGATHLLTLDRRHFHQVHPRGGGLPIIACTQGEFLRSFLPSE